jgi:hypothetical protein
MSFLEKNPASKRSWQNLYVGGGADSQKKERERERRERERGKRKKINEKQARYSRS